MPEPITVRRLFAVSEAELLALSDVLCDCVAGGASVSFMQPFSLQQALHYWRGVSASVARAERALLVAEHAGRIFGTVQVVLAQPDNQPHRGDVSKMLVARAARRLGAGALLMAAAESTARACGKTLLVLDTASADAERLYQRLGWSRLGVIPGYALLPDGSLCDTTYYYRILPPTDAVLDNPVWHALVSAQRGVAQLHGQAARFRADLSPLAGLREPTARALQDLRVLAAPGEQLWLLSDGPLALPSCWREVRARYIDQMVSTGAPSAPRGDTGLVELGDADVADMAALVALTKPGPFEAHTRDLGTYLGVRAADGRLVAMSGQRMNLTHYREISAVCSHPEARGRGLTAPLMAQLMERIVAEGKTPFLHVKTENGGAKAVYQKLGFTVRRAIYFSIIAAV